MKKLNDEEYYRDVLEKAYEIAGDQNDFVNSCEDFLNSRGFLTEKQVQALQKVRPPRDPDDYDDYEIDGDPGFMGNRDW